MSSESSDQRRSLRFPPQEWEVALIQCSDAATDEKNFQPEIAGLVMEESRAGCGLVVLDRQLLDRQLKEKLKIGDRCQVKVASLGVVLAEVMWIRPVEDGISRVGFHYVD